MSETTAPTWPTIHVLPPASGPARQRLDDALVAANHRTPCREGDDDAWFASEAAERARAAQACAPCPVLDACRAYAIAARERHGVWGGRDREDRKTRATSTTRGQRALDPQESR